MNATADAATTALAFVRQLRDEGIVAGDPLAFVDAVHVLGAGDADRVYWAGRATLAKDPSAIEIFDRVFASFWLARSPSPAARAPERIPAVLDDRTDSSDEPGAEPGGGNVLTVRYSPHERVRHKDFARCTPEELDEAHRLMARIRVGGARRWSSTWRPAKRRGRRPDVRAIVRAAVQAGGEPAGNATLARVDRPRRVVLLCDVSGSMAPYSRALLRFLHAAVAGRTSVEAFTLGTRLTRVTRELSTRDADAALSAAGAAVDDWSGGTRLGRALRTFNDEWGLRGMARGAVVVILSDGWDRGEPDALAEEMARLHRVAHKIVWVNPLKASPGYEPLARGMAAALPFVDAFVSGHSVAALEDLAEVVAA